MSQEVKVIGIISVLTLAILLGGIFILGKQGATTPTETQKADTATLVRADSNKTQAKNKKVTLVEFGDFQCPACGAFFPIVEQIKSAHTDTVEFVFRHFPLSQHANAIPAALAAEAAGKQGQFWNMYEVLYKNQNDWAESSDARNMYIEYAKRINLNVEEFTKDFDNKVGQAKVDQDQGDGISLGVNSTPTFYVNGEKLENNSALKDTIEQALK